MKRIAIVAGIVGALALGLLFFKPEPVPMDAVTLKPNEKQKITITPHQIINTREDKLSGKVESTIIPNYGHGTTTVIKKDGSVTVKAKEFGYLENDFGLSTDFRNAGVATELVYWRRLSWLGGTHFINLRDGALKLHLFTAIGYRLPVSKLNNVSIYTGIDTDRKMIFGMYLRFGNS